MFWSPRIRASSGRAKPSIWIGDSPPKMPPPAAPTEPSSETPPRSTPITKNSVTHRAKTIMIAETKSVHATDLSPPARARKVMSTAAKMEAVVSSSGVMRLMMYPAPVNW